MNEHSDWSTASDFGRLSNGFSLQLLHYCLVWFYFLCVHAMEKRLNEIVMHTVALNEMIWIDEPVEVIIRNDMGMWFIDGMLTHKCYAFWWHTIQADIPEDKTTEFWSRKYVFWILSKCRK